MTVNKVIRLKIDTRTSADVVEDLVPTIEHYRSQGSALRKIYVGLLKERLLGTGQSSQMAFNTFKKAYYERRNTKTLSLQQKSKSPTSPIETNDYVNIVDSKLDDEAPPRSQALKNKEGFKRLELGGTLEQQLKTGSMYFRK